MRRFLLIPHLKIHNANAISSPYTIGFPAMTSWIGAVHALQRYLHEKELTEVSFKKIAVSCHSCDLKTHKGKGDYIHSIVGTSNPLDKDGKRPAFIEEARCDLDVSILIEYDKLNKDKESQLKDLINAYIPTMKWASGDLILNKAIETDLLVVDEDDDQDYKKIIRSLMPGHVLIERRDLMVNSMNEGQNALDALLSYLKVMHRSEQISEDELLWSSARQEAGWLVPIAVGFQGIGPVEKAKNQRDPSVPHRFAESVVTLGQFIMPYRIRNLDDRLWQYHVDVEKNLYLCCNSKTLF